MIGIKTRLFRARENLINFLVEYLPQLNDGCVVAVSSKIVALSQGRVADLKDKKQLIIKESEEVIETPWALLTLTNEGWCLNAGVDESNADGKIILPARTPAVMAHKIWTALKKQFSLRQLGIIITDTKSLPLRVGTVGRTVAYAGFDPLRSYIGQEDLFGYKSRFTESNVTDALAATTTLIMGEGRELIPLVIMKDVPIVFTARKQKVKSLALSPKVDIYAKVYKVSARQSRKPSNRRRF